VEYSLSERGKSFFEVLEVMEVWRQKYLQDILKAEV
jgi:DNA-binding HxlR family transcriptional regulator